MEVIQAQLDAAILATNQTISNLAVATRTRDNLIQIINAQQLLSAMTDHDSITAAIAAMNSTISILQAKLDALNEGN